MPLGDQNTGGKCFAPGADSLFVVNGITVGSPTVVSANLGLIADLGSLDTNQVRCRAVRVGCVMQVWGGV